MDNEPGKVHTLNFDFFTHDKFKSFTPSRAVERNGWGFFLFKKDAQ
jgi:hypothetical protein